MPVTNSDSEGALSPVELNEELFDERCSAQGAKTEIDKAKLIGTERRNLLRWRDGEVTPGLDAALRTAQTLDTTVEALWKLRKPSSKSAPRVREYAS